MFKDVKNVSMRDIFNFIKKYKGFGFKMRDGPFKTNTLSTNVNQITQPSSNVEVSNPENDIKKQPEIANVVIPRYHRIPVHLTDHMGDEIIEREIREMEFLPIGQLGEKVDYLAKAIFDLARNFPNELSKTLERQVKLLINEVKNNIPTLPPPALSPMFEDSSNDNVVSAIQDLAQTIAFSNTNNQDAILEAIADLKETIVKSRPSPMELAISSTDFKRPPDDDKKDILKSIEDLKRDFNAKRPEDDDENKDGKIIDAINDIKNEVLKRPPDDRDQDIIKFIKALSGQIADLPKPINYNASISSLSNQIANIPRPINYTPSIEYISKQIGNLKEPQNYSSKFESLDQRISNIVIPKTINYDQDFKQLELTFKNSMQAINNKIDNIVIPTAPNYTSSLNTINSTIGGLKAPIDYSNSLEAIKNELATLKNKPEAKDYTQELNFLKKKLSDIESQNTGIEQQNVSNLNSLNQQNKLSIETLSGKLQSSVDALKFELNKLEKKVNTIESSNVRINNLNGDNSLAQEINSKIDLINNKFSENNETTKEIQEAQFECNNRLKNLAMIQRRKAREEEMLGLLSFVKNNINSMAQLQSFVEKNKNKRFDKDEDDDTSEVSYLNDYLNQIVQAVERRYTNNITNAELDSFTNQLKMKIFPLSEDSSKREEMMKEYVQNSLQSLFIEASNSSDNTQRLIVIENDLKKRKEIYEKFLNENPLKATENKIEILAEDFKSYGSKLLNIEQQLTGINNNMSNNEGYFLKQNLVNSQTETMIKEIKESEITLTGLNKKNALDIKNQGELISVIESSLELNVTNRNSLSNRIDEVISNNNYNSLEITTLKNQLEVYNNRTNAVADEQLVLNNQIKELFEKLSDKTFNQMGDQLLKTINENFANKQFTLSDENKNSFNNLTSYVNKQLADLEDYKKLINNKTSTQYLEAVKDINILNNRLSQLETLNSNQQVANEKFNNDIKNEIIKLNTVKANKSEFIKFLEDYNKFEKLTDENAKSLADLAGKFKLNSEETTQFKKFINFHNNKYKDYDTRFKENEEEWYKSQTTTKKIIDNINSLNEVVGLLGDDVKNVLKNIKNNVIASDPNLVNQLNETIEIISDKRSSNESFITNEFKSPRIVEIPNDTEQQVLNDTLRNEALGIETSVVEDTNAVTNQEAKNNVANEIINNAYEENLDDTIVEKNSTENSAENYNVTPTTSNSLIPSINLNKSTTSMEGVNYKSNSKKSESYSIESVKNKLNVGQKFNPEFHKEKRTKENQNKNKKEKEKALDRNRKFNESIISIEDSNTAIEQINTHVQANQSLQTLTQTTTLVHKVIHTLSNKEIEIAHKIEANNSKTGMGPLTSQQIFGGDLHFTQELADALLTYNNDRSLINNVTVDTIALFDMVNKGNLTDQKLINEISDLNNQRSIQALTKSEAIKEIEIDKCPSCGATFNFNSINKMISLVCGHYKCLICVKRTGDGCVVNMDHNNDRFNKSNSFRLQILDTKKNINSPITFNQIPLAIEYPVNDPSRPLPTTSISTIPVNELAPKDYGNTYLFLNLTDSLKLINDVQKTRLQQNDNTIYKFVPENLQNFKYSNNQYESNPGKVNKEFAKKLIIGLSNDTREIISDLIKKTMDYLNSRAYKKSPELQEKVRDNLQIIYGDLDLIPASLNPFTLYNSKVGGIPDKWINTLKNLDARRKAAIRTPPKVQNPLEVSLGSMSNTDQLAIPKIIDIDKTNPKSKYGKSCARCMTKIKFLSYDLKHVNPNLPDCVVCDLCFYANFNKNSELNFCEACNNLLIGGQVDKVDAENLVLFNSSKNEINELTIREFTQELEAIKRLNRSSNLNSTSIFDSTYGSEDANTFDRFLDISINSEGLNESKTNDLSTTILNDPNMPENSDNLIIDGNNIEPVQRIPLKKKVKELNVINNPLLPHNPFDKGNIGGADVEKIQYVNALLKSAGAEGKGKQSMFAPTAPSTIINENAGNQNINEEEDTINETNESINEDNTAKKQKTNDLNTSQYKIIDAFDKQLSDYQSYLKKIREIKNIEIKNNNINSDTNKSGLENRTGVVGEGINEHDINEYVRHHANVPNNKKAVHLRQTHPTLIETHKKAIIHAEGVCKKHLDSIKTINIKAQGIINHIQSFKPIHKIKQSEPEKDPTCTYCNHTLYTRNYKVSKDIDKNPEAGIICNKCFDKVSMLPNSRKPLNKMNYDDDIFTTSRTGMGIRTKIFKKILEKPTIENNQSNNKTLWSKFIETIPQRYEISNILNKLQTDIILKNFGDVSPIDFDYYIIAIAYNTLTDNLNEVLEANIYSLGISLAFQRKIKAHKFQPVDFSKFHSFSSLKKYIETNPELCLQFRPHYG